MMRFAPICRLCQRRAENVFRFSNENCGHRSAHDVLSADGVRMPSLVQRIRSDSLFSPPESKLFRSAKGNVSYFGVTCIYDSVKRAVSSEPLRRRHGKQRRPRCAVCRGYRFCWSRRCEAFTRFSLRRVIDRKFRNQRSCNAD